MISGAALRESIAPLVDLVYPPRCPACGDAIARQDGLCAQCWAGLVLPSEPACAACQRPFAVDQIAEGALCPACLVDPPRHDGIVAAALYNDTARKLVLAYKHGRRIGLAPMLARLVAARMPGLEGEWLLVPVPLHRWRLWRRGFNQAALLAHNLGRELAQPVLVDALVRRKPTPTLGGLGRKERSRALRGAIVADRRHLAALDGAQVILVDDVLTSGATSDACVAALRRAGAAKVKIACCARVIDGQSPAATGRAVPHNETPEAEAPGAT